MNILLMIIIILAAGGTSYILYKKNKLDKTVEYLVKLLEIYGKHVLNKVKLVLLINTLRTWVLANTENKVLKFFIPGLTAVILTGITEPIEFTFIFISPILWIINSIFAGLAFLVPAVFNVAIGNIQGGIIDWLVFGVLQGAQTKWYIFLFLGPIFFGLYYFSYKFIIEKFNILTLGRQKNDFEDDDISEDNNVEKLNENDEILAKNIVDGLGGLDNITDIDNCISRLRVEIKDMSKVNKDLLKLSNPSGIVTPDENTVHVVYGGRVTKMRNIVDDYVYKMKK